MDGSRFDLWTRRRLGRIAGGIAATIFGWATSADAAAKKKRRRKKKRKEGTSCKAANEACMSAGECCSGNCANLPSSEAKVCRQISCSSASGPCETHGDCCSGGCFENTNICFG